MPSEQINIRYNCLKRTGVVLRQEIRRDGWLTDGFMHFPPGCNALVQIRMMLETGGRRIEVTPRENQFVALDDANYAYPIDIEVKMKDAIIVEINNYDSVNAHQISVIVNWSTTRIPGQPGETVSATVARRA